MASRLLAFKIGEEFWLGWEKGIEGQEAYSSIGRFVSVILPNIFLAAGLILFFLILITAFGLLSAGGDSEKLKESSKTLTAAIAGFLIIFASFWILQLIQVITGIDAIISWIK